MKVLLLHNTSFQIDLLKSVCDNMFVCGIGADIYNLRSGEFYSPANHTVPSFVKWINKLGNNRPMWKLKRIAFYYIYIYQLARKYDVLDFQGLFVSYYAKVIPQMRNRGKRVIVTIWGSDFYRREKHMGNLLLPCLENANIIHLGTDQMKKDFLKVYPQYKNKIRICHFGLTQLDMLKSMLEGHLNYDADFMEIPQGKTVITCGYNGAREQRHHQIIDAISSLPEDVKDTLYLIVPMTYGGNAEYRGTVALKLRESGILHNIFTENLSLTEVMTLRIKSDIAVNIQTTDAFSGSIQEHIMAGSLLVVGDWLPYEILDDHGIFLCKTSLDTLSQNVLWAIKHYKDKRPLLKENKEKIYSLSSWQSCASLWSDIYKELKA